MMTTTFRRPLPDLLIDAAEAARRLGVEVETLWRWHSRGAGPAAVSTYTGALAFRSRTLEDWQDRVISHRAPLAN